MMNLASLLLTLTLVGQVTPQLEPMPPPAPWVVGTCAHIRALQIDYLSDTVLDLCLEIIPFFDGFQDRLHALFVVQCSSGGDPLANDRRWGHLTGGRPQGIWEFMTHLRWDLRLFGRRVDVYDTAAASHLAAALVYETRSGWFHWWSCHRGFNRYLARHGIRQVWYCPPDSYWQNVPAGSNFVCGGRRRGG